MNSVKVCRLIPWKLLEAELESLYTEEGRPALPSRLLAGIHFLKSAYNHSDESAVKELSENPYWQYFCGFEVFQTELPLDDSSLTRWRNRLGEKEFEKLLSALIVAAKTGNFLVEKDMQKVNVDTTVMEKAIAFPTDARLYFKSIRALVREGKQRGMRFSRTYLRAGKKALFQGAMYCKANQRKRAKKQTLKLRTFLGRIHRQVRRAIQVPDLALHELLDRTQKIHSQERKDKNKIYSVHAPEVECIPKGKAHKKYEFGCKVSLVSSAMGGWILAAQAHHGAPYDGHTLNDSLAQMERITQIRPSQATVDMGYRGVKTDERTTLLVANRNKKVSREVRMWIKRRASIEPIFGHLKSDHGMNRNFLKGTHGDIAHGFMTACGFNLRKLLRAVLATLFSLFASFRTRSVRLYFFVPSS